MKTIFISSFHPLISRNILQAKFLSILLNRGAKLVVLVPAQKVEYFKKTFASERVIIEGISIPRKRFESFMQPLSFGLVGVENHIVRGWKTEGHYFKYYTAHIIHMLFSHFFVFHKLFRFISRAYLRSDVFDSLFASYKPNLVFATDSFDSADRLLLLEAARARIRTIGMIRSWDNATTKGVFLPEPNHIIVPNEVLKEEMIAIHHFSTEKITVTGVPHYDLMIGQRNISREELFKEIGLDSRKKTIFFSPGGKILYKHDREVLELFKKNVDAGRFILPVQFLVSIQPGDTIDTSSIDGDPNFVIYTFGTNVTGRRKENEVAPDENERLNDFLFHSDIVITLGSTIAIDALVFNKPVVIFGFDPKPGLKDSAKKFAKYSHLDKFFNSGMTVSKSEDEFIHQMNDYLENPSQGDEKRRMIVGRYVYKLDGKSSERLAECLLRLLFPSRE